MPSILYILWGDLTREEYKKFGLLSVTLSFIVGTYWLLRPLKDALFANMVGALYLPYAKIVSAIFLIPIILLYSKLVDV
jgi:ATP:ADP antiporter, AAA family